MTNLRIPGPTPCPDVVLKEMGRQMINHRGPEFKKILFDVTDKLKQVFKTKNDVFILTGSGTGGLEAAVVNSLSPGDKVLSVSIGAFGDRFAAIAKEFGADVIELKYDWGKAADADEVRQALVDKENEHLIMEMKILEKNKSVVWVKSLDSNIVMMREQLIQIRSDENLLEQEKLNEIKEVLVVAIDSLHSVISIKMDSIKYKYEYNIEKKEKSKKTKDKR